MLRAVIFDMDGVLVDSEHFYHCRRGNFMHSKGMEIPPLDAFVGTNEKFIWELMVPGDELLRAELQKEYYIYCENHPIPYAELAAPGVRELFRELKHRGMKIGVASSSALWMIERMAGQLGLSEYIDHMHSGTDCKAHKPDPEIYLRSLEALGIPAEDAAAVEDSLPGIQSAQAAGLKTFGCAAFCDHPQTQKRADVILLKLTDLVNYL